MFLRSFAPMFRALGATQQSDHDSRTQVDSKLAEDTPRVPDLDYPVPLLVRNTFIDAEIGRPCSLEGFFKGREVHSTPTSLIELSGVEEASHLAATKLRLGRSPEEQGSSSCRSTSLGSSVGDSSTEDNTARFAELESRLGRRGSTPSSRLPEFYYPEPLFVKNTFIHAEVERSLSLDSCMEERCLQSCPGSLIHQPRVEVSSGLPCSVLPMGIPPPPVEPPALLTELPQLQTLGIPPPPAKPPAPLASTEAAPAFVVPEAQAQGSLSPVVLELSRALEGVFNEFELPSLGSADHHGGNCKPCAHFHTTKGCKNGAQCSFCHLCPPGELKRQQKAKRVQRRAAAP